jgi:transcriptional regulator with XRE-family HTH domain
LLRYWRDVRRKSQIDLSLDTGVSQRHISFIESGRSTPSRATLMDLARGLDVPLRERNALLLAAGYAPLYSNGEWNALEMQSVRRALDRMLRLHNPFPALVMDRYWNVLMTNESAPRFFGCFIDMTARKGPRNMLHLLFDPDGMRPFVVNWTEVARSLVDRVAREAIGRVVDAETQTLLTALHNYPDVPSNGTSPLGVMEERSLPMVPISLLKDGATMNYFSMVTTVGTPQTVAAQELRIECMFPADDATEAHHMRLFEVAP